MLSKRNISKTTSVNALDGKNKKTKNKLFVKATIHVFDTHLLKNIIYGLQFVAISDVVSYFSAQRFAQLLWIKSSNECELISALTISIFARYQLGVLMFFLV